MTSITFKNNNGEFTAFGGGNGDIRILAADGLGFIGKTYETASFINTPGQKTINETVNARTITISCDIKRTENTQALLAFIVRVLSEETQMYISSGNVKRKIICRSQSVGIGEKKGNAPQTLTIQLICDNPYFTDYESTAVPALGTENKLTDGFVLPMIFTEFTNGGVIENKGDTNAEPTIRIIGFGENEITSIKIENLTTGKSVILNTTASNGEIITVDIYRRKITSNTRTDYEMLQTLDLGSYLSNFYLVKGKNTIQATAYGDNQNTIGITVEYDNQYMEAVI